jgi:aminoglycoside 6'-N-acetyltransferase
MPNVELQAFHPGRDLSLITTWLSHPHVARWWGEPRRAFSELCKHRLDAEAIIVVDAKPVGYLCWQSPSQSELKEAGLADLPGDLVDVDIMIGEPDAIGRGVGPEALRQLFEKLRVRGVRLVGAAAALANKRALGAYAKVGLRPFRDFVELDEQYRYFTKCLFDANQSSAPEGRDAGKPASRP